MGHQFQVGVTCIRDSTVRLPWPSQFKGRRNSSILVVSIGTDWFSLALCSPKGQLLDNQPTNELAHRTRLPLLTLPANLVTLAEVKTLTALCLRGAQ